MKKFSILLITVTLLMPIFSLQAQEVNLIWSADTYVPPFYKGLPVFSSQSVVNFIAIPIGLGPTSEMEFIWTKNGTIVGGASGAYRNTFASLDTIISKPQTIKIEILSEHNGSASSTVTVTPTAPGMLVYENNPLYGYMFHKDVGQTFELKEKEITLAAFPIFFASPTRYDSEIKYQWLNNNNGSETRNQITYRTPDGASGSAQISVRANNLSDILQEATKGFLLKFNNPDIPTNL